MILDTIVAHKRRELEMARRTVPLEQLKADGAQWGRPASLGDALRKSGVGLIAEVKRASPSRGDIALHWEPEHLAETYVVNGAAAVSVLTDRQFFRGALDFLPRIRSRLVGSSSHSHRHPLLRKDFLIDPYQLYESLAFGADAVLLIVAILSDEMLRHMLDLSRDLGMSALVEIHNEPELERSLANGAEIVGINSRDLRDFSVDLETFGRLAPLLPSSVLAVAESGVQNPEDIRLIRSQGADGVLVGEALVSASDVGRKVRDLVDAGNQPVRSSRREVTR